jgi:hypothetical protein
MSVIILKVIWDFSHAHRFFKNSKGSLEIKLKGCLNWNSNNLNFKNSQNLGVTTNKLPRVYKNIWEF